MTPDVLSNHTMLRQTAESAVRVTFDAFHKATREGFRLQDVSAAPLAQRRKMKSTDNTRLSLSSICFETPLRMSSSSSSSVCSNQDVTPCSNHPQVDGSLGFEVATSPSRSESREAVFNFRDARVVEYLSGMDDGIQPSPDVDEFSKDIVIDGYESGCVKRRHSKASDVEASGKKLCLTNLDKG